MGYFIRSLKITAGTFFLITAFLFAAVQTIHASGVVNAATEAALRSALVGGGTVTFAIDGTIVLANTLIITNDTVLDGSGHLVTLSGNGAVRVLQVNSSAHATFKRLTIADGHVNGDAGGGLQNDGEATIVDCTFSNNVTTAASGTTFGGAINHHGSGLTVMGSTFVRNLSSLPGGAIASGSPGFGPSGRMRITNCTFYANSSVAIAVGEPLVETIWIVNCTFAWNTNGAISENLAGMPSSPYRVNLINNIFAYGVGNSNALGNVVDAGNNLCSDGSTVFTNASSLIYTDPQLGPLTNNSGPTLTMLPQPGSPAIDGGNNSASPLIDQRGTFRPFGAFTDIGSVESTVAGTNPGIFKFASATNNAVESNTPLSLTVLRAGGVAGAVSVSFVTSNGTAVAGQDYVATNGTLDFASNQRSNTFFILLLDDSQPKPLETFFVVLTNATGGATLGQSLATVNITDNDIGFCFAASDFVVNESGTNATITVNRTGPTAPAVTVSYSTSDGTAVAGSDYQGTSGVLSFGSGQSNATFTVTIQDDGMVETSETITLTLFNPSSGGLGNPSTATLTIVDNDTPQPGQLKFENEAYSVSEAAGQALIGVVRTSGNNVAVTVNYATTNGTATAGQDYAATSGTLTFNPGETFKSFSIPILNNAPVEGGETVNLTLSAPTDGASLAFPSSTALTIVDSSQSLASCDEPTLRAAVNAGGQVLLPCDGTIYLSSPLLIQKAVSLDASGHNLILSGNSNASLFIVYPGVSLDLRNLTLADGYATGSTGSPGRGGAISNGAGQVSILNCSLLANVAKGGSSASGSGVAGAAFGGAVYSSGGIVWASNTLFKANVASGGQGVGGSIFGGGDSADAYGGAICQTGGESAFLSCEFESNAASSPTPEDTYQYHYTIGSAYGGAIFHSNGVVTLTGCQFINNTAMGETLTRSGAGAGRGGAVWSASLLTIGDTTFISNQAIAGEGGAGSNGEGGALFLRQPASISTSVFSGNIAKAGKGYTGGAFPLGGGAAYGGNIYTAAALTLTDSTLASGQALGDTFNYYYGVPGMSAFGGGLFNSGSVCATNVTFSGNQAVGGSSTGYGIGGNGNGGNANGGALCNVGGTVQIIHGTFSSNFATGGSGSPIGLSLGGGIQNSNGTVTLIDSIVANTLSGGNAFGPLVDGGHNISSDGSCGFSAPGSLNNTDPVLGPLDDFGGPTPTMPLFAGSPAIDGGDNTASPQTDQRGHARPYGAASDIGAFESSPPYTVVGNVTGNMLIDELAVSAGSSTCTTFNHGHYSLQGLPANSYSVFPSDSDHIFSPSNHIVTVGPDQIGVDFKAYRMQALNLEGFANNNIQFMYAGASGQNIQLLGSTNLFDWFLVSTNTVGPSNLLGIPITVLPWVPKLFFRTVGD